MGNGQGDKPAKPKRPKLPKSAPQDLKDFVSCKIAKVELSPGKIDWLPIPISPDVKFKPGAAGAGSVDIEMKLPLKDEPITVPAKVNAEGKLEVDPANLPFGADGANDWVKELNDWLASRNRKLGPPEIKDGKLVLTKIAVAAAAPRQGAFLPHVPRGEKFAGGALVVLATVAGVAMMPSDSTGPVTERIVPAVEVAVTTTTAAPATTTTTAPEVVEPDPDTVDRLVDVMVVNDACLALGHGDAVSYITLVFTGHPGFDGPFEMNWGQTPNGPLTGTGTMTGGVGRIETEIFSFGDYQDALVRPVGGQDADLSRILDLFPFVVGPDEQACDASSLEPAPVATGTDTEPAPEPEPEPEPEPAAGSDTPADDGPATGAQVETVQEQTDAGPPWSLLLIPGTILFVGGGLVLDEERRKRRVEMGS